MAEACVHHPCDDGFLLGRRTIWLGGKRERMLPMKSWHR